MKFILKIILLSLIGFLISCQSDQKTNFVEKLSENKKHLSPDVRYGTLFHDIQMGEVFPDSKTFTDCTPKQSTDKIVAAYNKEKGNPDFNLKDFVISNFDLPIKYASGFASDVSRSPAEHVNALWPVLTREPDQNNNGTLFPLPKSYIVPGGRFGEIYYWDSYFTILGLEVSGKYDMIENMADNFSYLIDTLGYVPNGNRTYFLGRSQPPFYSLIVKILSNKKGKEKLIKYLPYLEKEYQFWMEGISNLSADNTSHRRLVRMQDGSILNRYWDDVPKARPESYKEDVSLAESLDIPKVTIYRNIRAACESGWDFSSRWFKDQQYLASIHTTEIIPIDLNALIYHLEETLAEAYTNNGDEENAELMQQRMTNRKNAIQRFCWQEDKGFFMDYDWVARRVTEVPSLAGMYPLFFAIADSNQSIKVAQKIEKDFLKPGGVVSTLNETGQQWDAPNGWAPLQWITIQGLRNYGFQSLSDDISKRWTDLNIKVYKQTGKMVEKYNVLDINLEAGGGEYPVQDGFGWTNGVLLKLLDEQK